jgi:hypothetical protein
MSLELERMLGDNERKAPSKVKAGSFYGKFPIGKI